MPPTHAIDAHVRLDEHPTHTRAVIATLTGAQAHVAHVALEAADWTVVGENILALVRIDAEEPYWAKDAATHLAAEGITVDIAPRLQEAMDEEWTWVNYPMPWCTRSEVREVSNEAQKIHDDIRHGHLLIHAHAHDGHTTVAVGTYLHGTGKSVYLHGENHLRQVADTFDSPAQALLAFEKIHGAQMRPGPAPLTDTERSAAEARKPLAPLTAEPEPPAPEPVPVYLADAGDHDALLDGFLDAHGEFEKWRTWSDETTHAIHESQTLRIERVHETQPRDIAWTIAAYETPVSERMWVLSATAATPAPVLEKLLNHLADGDGWDTAVNTPLDESAVTTTAQPLAEAGWQHNLNGHGIHWTSPDGQAGVQFDSLTAQHPQNPATWTIWSGPGPDRPTWAITASPHTPSSLLAGLSETLAHDIGHRRPRAAGDGRGTGFVTSPLAIPAVAVSPAASRSR
ncbi:DUF317 domain-containing protein [Streptomyces sp. NPDC001828]|uniref:DUF317 domain-containing protein n=1 Tax=Streptomyces sp. NPDC001828 TaxID=3364615 RepID=UPI0036BBCA7A